jgi:hypothetical protein
MKRGGGHPARCRGAPRGVTSLPALHAGELKPQPRWNPLAPLAAQCRGVAQAAGNSGYGTRARGDL